MSHKILQRLWIHACLRLIATVGMSAHMRRDVRHLDSVNVVVPIYHIVESMLPMHCYQRFSFLIVKEESGVTIDDFLNCRCFSIFNDGLKHCCHIIRNRDFTFPGICFRFYNNVS